MRLIVPSDWDWTPPEGSAVCRRRAFSPCLEEVSRALAESERLFVIGTDGMAAKPCWLLATDHVNLFGDGPLVGPNDDAEGPRFPSLSGLYLDVEGPFGRGTVLRTPDWRLATPAELEATGAAAAVTEGVLEAVKAGHGGARAALLVRCHGPNRWNRTAPPLSELVEGLSRRADI